MLVGEDTVWLTQRQMADLFDTGSRNVGINIQNAYGEGFLVEGATAKDSFVVRSVGGRQVHRRVQDYNRGHLGRLHVEVDDSRLHPGREPSGSCQRSARGV